MCSRSATAASARPRRALLLIAVNTALALGAATFGLLDVLGIGLAALMIAVLVARAARNLKRLSELEPA